ncbi:MAG: ABC transporter ATP-binding protein [Bacteroidota bacterium]
MAVFTILSIPLLKPIFEFLFEQTELITVRPEFQFTLEGILLWAQYQLSQIITESGRQTALIYVCIAIVSNFFLKNLFRYLALFFLAPVRNGIIRDVREQLFNKLLILPLGYFSEEKKGDIISRATADVQEIEYSILNVLEAFFREPLIIIGAITAMLYISPSLTVFVLILIVFTGVVIGGIGKSLKKTSHLVQEKLANLVSIIEEALGGLRIIKGFTAEDYQRAKFKQENDAYRNILTRLLWRRDLSSPMSEFLGITVVAILLWYGSSLVFSGSMDGSTFLLFIFSFYTVIEPAKAFAKAFYNVQKGIAAVNRIEKILDVESSIIESKAPLPLAGFEKEISYKNVSFAYKAEEGDVLKDINFTLPKGKVIALVGPSGAGKSTIADLLPRFYDVNKGAILIDGKDIREFSLHQLRSLMGIVSQDAILFNDSIYNNIVFGLDNIIREDVIRAAKIANAHDFIMATEQGYETNIGDRGMKLSGGQRQRLTIARAVLKNPAILILDEATSALDTKSEKLVQESLLKLMQQRTSIVIAHRLSTIQHADEILVMKDGQIIERGSHHDLLDKKGEYQKLVGLQNFG